MTPRPQRHWLRLHWDVSPSGAATSADPETALRSVTSAAWRHRRTVRHLEPDLSRCEAVDYHGRATPAAVRFVETDAPLTVERATPRPPRPNRVPFLGDDARVQPCPRMERWAAAARLEALQRPARSAAE